MVEWFGIPEIETDEVRERRITMEAVVDAYDEQVRAIGWYYYLERRLDFPFLARCATRRSTSPLKVGEEVEVIGMAPVEECEHDMFVEMAWDDEGLAIPLPARSGRRRRRNPGGGRRLALLDQEGLPVLS